MKELYVAKPTGVTAENAARGYQINQEGQNVFVVHARPHILHKIRALN